MTEQEKELSLLKASYDMYEETKKETKKEMKEKTNEEGKRIYSDEDIKSRISLIEEAQKGVVDD